MELSLFGMKRQSQRPPSPEDAEFADRIKHRFSRALGLFHLLAREQEEQHVSVSRDLSTFCRPDCLNEVYDAMASDAYRAFLERELGAHFRLEHGAQPTLYAASFDGLSKLEGECRERLDRRVMDRDHSFGIAVITAGAGRLARKKESVMSYEPLLHDGARELVELRTLMASFPYRDSLQRQLEIGIGFQLPNHLFFTRRTGAITTPSLAEQLRLEGVI